MSECDSNNQVVSFIVSHENTPLYQSFNMILQAVHEHVHMHIYCLRVIVAGCFPDFYSYCKY